jgi:hypothetical protein
MKYFTGDIFADNAMMIEILLDSKLYTGTDRKKKYKEFKGVYPTSKQCSATFGYTRRGKMSENKCREESQYYSYYMTKTMSDNPHLEAIFDEYALYHLPEDFFFSQVQINYDFDIQPHKDSLNQQESWIVGLGEYKGGELAIEFEKGTELIDIRDKPYKFNGSKYTHWVQPYKGHRWSLVFFTHHTKEKLQELKDKKIWLSYNINDLSNNK